MFATLESPEGPNPVKKKITVLLVDDHTLVRRGFRRIVEDEDDMRVVGEAGDGADVTGLN